MNPGHREAHKTQIQNSGTHEHSNFVVKPNFYPVVYSKLSLSLSVTTYFFGGAMAVARQSTPVVFLSTFLSGTFFLANALIPSNQKMSEKDRCFNDVMAGWLWSLASLRQFMHYRMHRWCGYSSWTAFVVTSFLGLRWWWVSNKDISL